MAKTDCVTFSVYLPKPLVAWLVKQAEANHRSLNNYINLILAEHMKGEGTYTSAH